MNSIDSPRWCAHCQAWGDHHTDRCRATTVAPYIERDGRFWQVVFPAGPDDGMDLCTGPHFTRLGARLSLRFNNWLAGR